MKLLVAVFLASLCVVAGFSANTAFKSPFSKKIPSSKASIMHLHMKRKVALAMGDDDSSNNASVMDDEVNEKSPAESVLSESFVESVVMPDNTVIQNIPTETDLLAPISISTESDVAKEIVEAAMSDPSATDFIGEGGIVTEIPTTTTEQVIVDDSMPSSETVSAFLAASEEAVVAAEAKLLSPDESEMVPLIPKQAQNDTFGVATEVQEIPSILPASQVVGEPITAVPSKIDTPDVKKILKFAVPAIGVWLCGPLLSLIDTSAVGLFSGTFQQAALNPAVAVTDYAALLIVSTVLLFSFVCP